MSLQGKYVDGRFCLRNPSMGLADHYHGIEALHRVAPIWVFGRS